MELPKIYLEIFTWIYQIDIAGQGSMICIFDDLTYHCFITSCYCMPLNISQKYALVNQEFC